MPRPSTDVSDDSIVKSVNKDSATSRINPNQMVRTDSREQKLDAFLVSSEAAISTSVVATKQPTAAKPHSHADRPALEKNALPDEKRPRLDVTDCMDTDDFDELQTTKSVTVSSDSESESAATRRAIKLTSVEQLKRTIESDMHNGLRVLLQSHSFVGCVSPEFALVQHDTKLYLVNTTKLSKELFYQLVILNFGNLGYMRLSEPASILELAMLALDSADSGWTPDDGPKSELAQYVADLLVSKAEMLDDYFSVKIDASGNLLTLPLILDKYIPSIEGLPMYVLRLATEVEWQSEKECFETFARETSEFFAIHAKWLVEVSTDEEQPAETVSESGAGTWRWMVEHVVYPAARSCLSPPTKFTDDATFLQIANMPDLYRVFERC